jgi:hypothetical protein
MNSLPENPSYAEAVAFYKTCCLPGLIEMFSWATVRTGRFSANLDNECGEFLELKEQGFFAIPHG